MGYERHSPGSGIRQNLGMGYGLGPRNSLRASSQGRPGEGGEGREKEGELATTSLELNICIEKVDAKC